MEAILYKIAEAILHAALSPKTLALHRIIIAEATRFPELALAVTQQGTRQEAIKRIAALLSKDAPLSSTHNAVFAAEQFIHMLIAAPQRRALGMEKPLTAQELKMWVTDTIRLFLHGYHC